MTEHVKVYETEPVGVCVTEQAESVRDWTR